MAVTRTDHGTHTSWSVSGSDRTVSGASIGTAAADRIVVAYVGHERGSVQSATIGGVTANVISDVYSVLGTAIVWAEVPTGTTADIVLTFDVTNASFPIVAVSSATGMEATAYADNSGGANGTSVSTTLDIPANGAAFSIAYLRTAGSAAWTGLTEVDEENGTLNGRSGTTASDTGMSLETGRSISVTWGAAHVTSLTAVSFEEASGGGSDVEVSASTDALTLTENAASIALDVDVSASTAALTVTGQPATIALDTEIGASTDTLTLSPHQATVALDTNIQAAADSLTLTEYPATIEVGGSTNVNANTATLSLASHTASIAHDVSIDATTQALTVSGQSASITLYTGKEVQAALANLTLTANRATITKGQPPKDDYQKHLSGAGLGKTYGSARGGWLKGRRSGRGRSTY